MRQDCYFCHQNTLRKLIDKFKPGAEDLRNFLDASQKCLLENWDLSNPQLAREINLLAKQYFQTGDLYEEEKVKSNELLLGQYFYRKIQVEKSDNPFALAARLAVIGNIIDYGAHTVGENISDQMEALFEQELVLDEVHVLQEQIEKAESVLYLGDNAGEIVFDRLFIETMNHPNVTFVVRGTPVVNDATMDDAQHVAMDKVCRVITNGYDAPSTLLNHCSDELKEAFQKADVVISKGMGNFEGLMDQSRQNLFFMLIAKCQPIADLWNLQKGELLISRYNKNLNGL